MENKVFNAPKFGKLLVARPANMSFQRYKEERKYQTKRLKARLKGFLVYKASEIITQDKVQVYKTYPPCIGKKFIINLK